MNSPVNSPEWQALCVEFTSFIVKITHATGKVSLTGIGLSLEFTIKSWRKRPLFAGKDKLFLCHQNFWMLQLYKFTWPLV